MHVHKVYPHILDTFFDSFISKSNQFNRAQIGNFYLLSQFFDAREYNSDFDGTDETSEEEGDVEDDEVHGKASSDDEDVRIIGHELLWVYFALVNPIQFSQ